MLFAAFFKHFVQTFADPCRIVPISFRFGIWDGQRLFSHRVAAIREIESQRTLIWREPEHVDGTFWLAKHNAGWMFPPVILWKIRERHQDVRQNIERDASIGEYVPSDSLKTQALKFQAAEMIEDAFAHHVGAFEIFRLAKFGKKASPSIWVPCLWRQVRIAFVWRRGQRAVTSVRMVESRRYGRRVYAIRLQAAPAGWTRRIASCFAIVWTGKRHKFFWRDHFTSIDCVSGHGPSSISDSLNHINLMLSKKGKLASAELWRHE